MVPLCWSRGVLSFLTYALSSLSPASPSVRRLHPKSSQMASFPLFPNLKCLFTLKSELLLFLLWLWHNLKTPRWGERKQCQIVGTELICVSAHGVNNFLPWFDPEPLTLTPTHLTSTGLSTQWSDLVSNQSDPSETEIGWSQLLWKWALLGYKLCLQMTSNSQTSQNDLGIKQFFKLNLITGRGACRFVCVCVCGLFTIWTFFILSVDTISVSVS